MALDKNKAGIMAAIAAATEGPVPAKARAHRSLPKGTVGSVRAGMGGIQEVDPAVVQGWGPMDRMTLTAVNTDPDMQDFDDLLESIRTSGQQVPVLLRPAPNRDGYFDIIYGRRRLLACRELGIKVKALVRTLDDTEALTAKGLENASRSDLSYYERARFAQGILKQGYSREEAQRALAISKNTLSQLERITRLVPNDLGNAIGVAPKSGRPKWMALAAGLEKGIFDAESALAVVNALPSDTASDARLDAVLSAASKRGAKQARRVERTPLDGVTVKSAKNAVTVTIKSTRHAPGFSDWIDQNIDRLIMESYQSYKSEALDEAGS